MSRLDGFGRGFVDLDAVKSDTVDLVTPVREIYVGSIAGGAAVKVMHSNGSTATYVGIVAGSTLPRSLSIIRIYSTGTTASSLIGHI